jgi:CRISPR-associated protein Csb1
MASLTLKKLQEMTRNGAAARCRVTLQPAGGEGTKVFPPTYAGAVYATEKRRLPGEVDPVDCVLLDSVQSQANRMEEALQQAIDSERFKKAGVTLPLVEVDFSGFWDPEEKNTQLSRETRLLGPVGKVTALQAPHRIVDAILRDSVVVDDNKPFRAKVERNESSYGQRLRRVSAQNATALFELCPTALLLGMWDSTGPKGGLGAKFERAMVSEIVGINVQPGVKPSSRIDPLAIQKDAGPLYRRPDGGYTTDPSNAMDELKEGRPTGKKVLFKPNNKGADVFHDPKEASFPDQGRPSEANHGNVTPGIDYRRDQNRNLIKDDQGRPIPIGGFTITSAEQSVVLSLPALRRLRFPITRTKKGTNEQETILDPKIDDAARTVLTALGLCAAVLAAEAGLDLRSRCLLWPTAPLSWELLGKPGVKEEGVILEGDDAIQLLKATIDVATSTEIGLPWRTDPLRLVPSHDLVKLVVKSQQLAQAEGGEGGE